MKFLIEKETELYRKLIEVIERSDKVRKQCRDLAERLGAKEYVCRSGSVAGGIVGFILDEKPENWKSVLPNNFANAYFPKSMKCNRALIDEINKIPLVRTNEISEILMYGNYFGNKGQYSGCPQVWCGKERNYFLVSVPDWVVRYDPLPEMKEILSSEWKRLKAED